MKNKYGFTLVELLATIVIIGMLGGIAAIAYVSIIGQSEDRAYESYVDTMHAEMIKLLADSTIPLPKNGSTKKYNLSYLLTNNYIEKINNPRDRNDLCDSDASYVEVTRNNVGSVDSFTYKVCLVCNGYNQDGSKCKTFEN